LAVFVINNDIGMIIFCRWTTANYCILHEWIRDC